MIEAPTSAAGPGKTFQVTNPATGEVLSEVPVHGVRDVRASVERARMAQRSWGALSVKARAEGLFEFCETLVRHAEDLVDLLVLETGKARLEALINEVLVLADLLTWQCKHAPAILQDREVSLHLLKHRKGLVCYVPRGVVGVISPWNYPLMLPLSDLGQSTLAGNGTVLKPSEHAPLVVLKAKELWDKTGLPSDLWQVVTGGPETGTALIEAGIQKLAFTGGTRAGRLVAERCGRHLVECVLELGGKAPMIVCDDADLKRTARAITWGGFANMGQACVSVERVLAHTSIYDELVSLTREQIAALRQGDSGAADVDVGPLVLGQSLERLAELVSDALVKGAKLAAGGQRLPGKGQFFSPTLLIDCTPEMRVMQEEIFGPIVPMMRVESDAQAISIANSLPYGLSSYVFSRNTRRAEAIARQLEAGSVVINDVHSDIATPEVPFGGIKLSGYGRIHGPEGLRSMCFVKHISLNRTPLPARSPFWFPYSAKDFARVLAGLKLLYSKRKFLGRPATWL